MKWNRHDVLGVAVIVGSAAVAALRFTVPGHELSLLGSAIALLFIASGFLGAMALIRKIHDPAAVPSGWNVLMIPESDYVYGIGCALTWFFGACLMAFHVPSTAEPWPVVFEMIAHLWVGGLIAVAWWHWPTRLSIVTWGVLLAITTVETVAFLYRGKP